MIRAAGRRPSPGDPPRGDMGREHPSFLVVGHANKPHGTKGEIFVWPLTDYPERAFEPGRRLRVAEPEGNAPDETVHPLVVEGARSFRGGFLVKFREVGDRTAAEELRGRYLLVPFEEAEPLHPGEVFYHELLGAEVVTREGEVVGEVREVYALRPADLLEVRGRERTFLVPFVREIVREVQRESRRIVIDPPPGLLDL